MPDTYYKVLLAGYADGQNVGNILYYGNDVGDPFTEWDPAYAADLGDALVESLDGVYTDPLPTTYTLNTVRVTGIDSHGVTISDTYVDVPAGISGDQAVATDTPGICAIIRFTCYKTPDAGRVPKRSYIAYGPLHSTWVANNGELSSDFKAAVAPLQTLLGSNIVGGLTEYRPVRIGRTAPDEPTAIGNVVAVPLAPFARVRKSRMFTASGT